MNIQPIEGADRIEVATVNGWKVVVGKGDFNVGDLCVYFEIDSILPLDKFPELENSKGRIKTIRLRGQLSQGYCITFDRFKKILDDGDFWDKMDEDISIVNWKVGDDVTNFLGVEKYEPPILFKNGDAKGVFPSYILPKSDEDRIQSNMDYLDKFKGLPWVATVKYDGTSATFGYDNDEFFTCSRNLKIHDGDNVYWNIARKYKLHEIPPYLVVQGEVVGPGIQNNRLGLKDIEFHIFRVYDQLKKRYLFYDERIKLCKSYGIPHVALDSRGDHFDMTLEKVLDIAEGKYNNTKNEREGLVFEVDGLVNTEFGGHLSFKVISNKFLLKGGD